MSQGQDHPTSQLPAGRTATRWAMPDGPPIADHWAPTAAVPVATMTYPTYPTAQVPAQASYPPPAPPWAPPAPPRPFGQPTYRAPGSGRGAYPGMPPTQPPGAPPSFPPLGFQAPRPPEPPRRRGPVAAGIALIALIAIVLGLTAGVTIDKALQERDERVDARTETPSSNGSATTQDPSTDPSANGGVVDPSQNQPPSAPTGTAPTADEAAAIAAKVTPGLVNINTQLGYQSAAAAGTGMILSADGLVLTNNHVIDQSTVIQATVVGTGATYEAKVLGTAAELDIALIQLIDAHDLPTVKLDATSELAVGDPIVAAGNAGGKGGEPSVVSGVITALNRSITASDENGNNSETLHELIETNAPIQPGDSGGPLIDVDGEVIGMNTAASANNRFQSAQSVGYAIPIANALEIVDRIKAGEESDVIHLGLPGILGVQLDSRGPGALVLGVAADSPAAAAGISAGATITALDGTAISSSEQIGELLDGRKPGEKVAVSWTDGFGQSHTETLTLMEGPA